MRWLLVSVMMLFSLHSFAERIEMNNVPVSEFTDWYSKKTGKGVIVPDNFIEKLLCLILTFSRMKYTVSLSR